MLNLRVYKAGLVPALIALIVAAFSLQDPPRGLTTALPPDAFNGARAFTLLKEMAATDPDRRPGGAGDGHLAARVREVFARRSYLVDVDSFAAKTVDGERTLQTVVGRRVGVSSHQIVVLAHRDALAQPATAQLSGTAALLEIARVFEGRRQRRTITLVSTSGGSGGNAGALEFARATGGPIDAVIVVGDIAGEIKRRPYVVPWSDGLGIAPISLRRTVEAAVRLETGSDPGDVRGLSQLARLALPATAAEQGVVLGESVPAVLLQVSGEQGPGSQSAVSQERLTGFGRALLRTLTALDVAPTLAGEPQASVLVRSKVLPLWAIKLIVGALLFPALLAIIDGCARVARRRLGLGRWLVWALATALPFVLAAVFAWLLEVAGLLPPAPPAPWPGGAIALDWAAGAAMASVVLVVLAAWLTVRPLLVRVAGISEPPGTPASIAALMLVLGAVCVGVWFANPFAAAMLILPLHLWLIAASPEVRLPRAVAGLLVLVSLIPVVLVSLVVADALGIGGIQLPWTALLLVVGGQVGPLAVLAWCLVLGCFVALPGIVACQYRQKGDLPPPRTRGPISYAGPGSLGGTDSGFRR